MYNTVDSPWTPENTEHMHKYLQGGLYLHELILLTAKNSAEMQIL